MSLDAINDNCTIPKVVVPSDSVLGILKLKRPYYFNAVVQAGLERKYINDDYTVFVPKHVPDDITHQSAYTFCMATTVNGKLDPETLESSSFMIINTLDPARFIGLPQPIEEAIQCSNGWIYLMN
jgi:hypothetical protein